VKLWYERDGESVAVVVTRDGGGGARVRVGEREYVVSEVRRDAAGGLVCLVRDARGGVATVRGHVAREGERRYVEVRGRPAVVLVRALAPRRARVHAAAEALRAPMHGQVTKVLVAPGDVVAGGQTVVLMEAMKMELRIDAPRDGVVAAVWCAAGQVVPHGFELVEIAGS
jgi:3-methylcrotonyl-CoA carboxylase alpha subunit